MESRIPLPTDNIFKFYALFGLLLFVFSAGAVLYSNNADNQEIFTAIPEVEGLKALPKRTPAEEAKLAVLNRKIEMTTSDKKFVTRALGVLGGVGLLLLCYGFWKWQSAVQPILDRTAKVQLEIAEMNLEKLRRELGSSRPTLNAPLAPVNAERQEAGGSPAVDP